jgi:hypothetical protein
MEKEYFQKLMGISTMENGRMAKSTEKETIQAKIKINI